MRFGFRVLCVLAFGLLGSFGRAGAAEPVLSAESPQLPGALELAPLVEMAPAAAPPPVSGEERLIPAPSMIGDLTSRFAATQAFATNFAGPVKALVATSAVSRIADNESPRPLDRLFVTYNYANDLFTRPTSAVHANAGFPQVNLHQEVLGFEKTVLDGYASVGLRAPLFQIEGDGSLGRSDVGDLSFIAKYAWLNYALTGDVLSTGLVVTVPTGPDTRLADGTNLHPVLLQPYVGGLYNVGRLYVHGFSALAIPTDARDALLLFDDFGIGYRVYQNRDRNYLTALTPTVEAHLTTPLNHRGAHAADTMALDEVVLTYGVHVGLFHQLQLAVGAATPVTGPLPFDVAGFAQLNWRF